VNNTILLAQGSSAVFQLFDRVESVEMHNNVFYRVGGGGVTIIDDSNVTWTTGHEGFAGTNNWVQTGSASLPTERTGTLTGSDPGFSHTGSGDVRPLQSSPRVNAGANTTASAAGFPFPSPLATPLSLPPLDRIEAVDAASARPVV